MKVHTLIATAALAGAMALASHVAVAQQHGHDNRGAQMGPGTMGQGMGIGQGMGMGQGIMGHMMQGMPGMQGMMGGNCPMMGMMMGGAAGTFAEGRTAFLRAELGITDAQKAVFDAYAAALKENLNAMHAMRESMMGGMAAKTPVERLNAHLAAMESRTASLRAVKPKLEALYAAFTDDQKKKADQILTGMGCMM